MAVDPATIKSVAKVAISVLTNKETRSNLLYIIPITGAASYHHGTDFGGEWRSEIFSIADGVVVEVCTEKNDGYGNYIIVKHTGERTAEDGTVTTEAFYALYGHMNEIYMFEGQSLMGGDPEKDTTPGRSIGTHLHFEIRTTQSGSGVDPAGYIFPVPESEETTESEAVTSE